MLFTQHLVGNLRTVAGAATAMSSAATEIGGLLVPSLLFPFALVALGMRNARSAAEPFRWTFFAGHALLFLSFTRVSYYLRDVAAAGFWAMLLWLALGAASTAALAIVFLPEGLLSVRGAGPAWTVGLVVSVASMTLGYLAQNGWEKSASINASCVQWILGHMGYLPTLRPARVGTSAYAVIVSAPCSGYEGMALILVFTAAWLLWFRKEFRFPAALLLIPIGIALSWCFNVVRLVVLILIGHYGHGDIAMTGFHSRAGWIAFSTLAIAFCSMASRIPGVGAAAIRTPEISRSNPAAPYLVPFIAVQAAAILSAAASAQVEWFYPLRVVAGAAALAWYWRDYRALRTGDTRAALFVGLAVSGVWAALSLRLPHDVGLLAKLAGSSALFQWSWIGARLAGAVLLAPIVEELAFRGFLMRRIGTADFLQADPRNASWVAIAVSALAFGLMHGSRWPEGFIAGAAFAFAFRRKRELGDAMLAHAVANLALAILVGATGDWRYW
jgi:exosortase E/protease (VPEID-CTERM system)